MLKEIVAIILGGSLVIAVILDAVNTSIFKK